MSNYVFLIDAQKTPMNPIHPAQARKLLEQGKAAVFRRYPFTLIQQIKLALDSRRTVRRGRRSHNTRYRQPRFLNRKHPQGWLSPSLMHRVITTETWVKRLCKFAPVGEIRQELVKFDTQALDKPEISGCEYQQGTLFGYEVREYLLYFGLEDRRYCSSHSPER